MPITLRSRHNDECSWSGDQIEFASGNWELSFNRDYRNRWQFTFERLWFRIAGQVERVDGSVQQCILQKESEGHEREVLRDLILKFKILFLL